MYESIEDICSAFGVTRYFTDQAGLVGVRFRGRITWLGYRTHVPGYKGREGYMVTGTTNNPGPGASYHKCEGIPGRRGYGPRRNSEGRFLASWQH